MLLIQFTVPQKPLEGDFMEKVRNMDWLGSVLSLTMTICILVGNAHALKHLSKLSNDK
jgi:hypothetical protein